MITPFRPGLEFKNGRLLQFTRYSVMVMRPWPEPLAWKRTTRKLFHPVRPRIPLVPRSLDESDDPESHARACEKLGQFMEPVPAECLSAIGQFTSRQWHMMALLARCPGALDLVQSTPALAFALASNWVFPTTGPSQPMRSARRLVRLPQSAICEWLGFPARRSSVNVLRKLRTADISIASLLYLRDGLWDEEAARLLRHCRVITRQTIRIATTPAWRRHFSPRFLAELPEAEKNCEAEVMPRSCALFILLSPDMLRRLRASDVFHSMAEVENYIAWVAGNIRRARLPDCAPELRLPQPPIPGTCDIVPLSTGFDLLEESREMEHCVADLHASVTAGEYYFYRVRAPERATLSLRRCSGGWEMGELLGRRNAPVAGETRRAVYAWYSVFTDGGAHDPQQIAEAEEPRKAA